MVPKKVKSLNKILLLEVPASAHVRGLLDQINDAFHISSSCSHSIASIVQCPDLECGVV